MENDRLNYTGYLWAFSPLRASAGANAHYRRRREQGDWHAAAWCGGSLAGSHAVLQTLSEEERTALKDVLARCPDLQASPSTRSVTSTP